MPSLRSKTLAERARLLEDPNVQALIDGSDQPAAAAEPQPSPAATPIASPEGQGAPVPSPFPVAPATSTPLSMPPPSPVIPEARYPWDDANPAVIPSFKVRMPAPLLAKLDWIVDNTKGRSSIQKLALAAIEKAADTEIAAIQSGAPSTYPLDLPPSIPAPVDQAAQYPWHQANPAVEKQFTLRLTAPYVAKINWICDHRPRMSMNRFCVLTLSVAADTAITALTTTP